MKFPTKLNKGCMYFLGISSFDSTSFFHTSGLVGIHSQTKLNSKDTNLLHATGLVWLFNVNIHREQEKNDSRVVSASKTMGCELR